MLGSNRIGILLCCLLAIGCTDSSQTDDADAAAGGDQPMMDGDETRIAQDPTAADELPAAVLGTAPPPRGFEVNYFLADPATSGYLAVPAGEGPFPAIILVHEWNGLVDRIRQIADALAAEGYVALAADLFRGQTGDSPEENMALMREANADPQWIIDNLNAALSFLRARDDVSGRVGAMGWCFGGGVALSFGLDGVNHAATAVFYGRLVDDPSRLAELSHEVYGTFAGLDDGPSRADVEGFVSALREAGVPNDIHIYDDVDHGFWLWVDEQPDVRHEPALDAWQRLKAYLQRTLR